MLDSIGADERQRMLRSSVRRRFARGEVVFHQGDPGDALHIVTSGVFIARSVSTTGELIAVNMISTGGVFGELALLTADARRTATIIAIRAGGTLMISRSHFEDLRASSPSIDRFLVSVLAERNRTLSNQLVELVFTPVEQRVHRRLLAFAAAMTEDESNGWVRLSQGELAVLAGTTRSTTNRILRRAEVDGLVQLGRGRVRVIDASGLSKRAR